MIKIAVAGAEGKMGRLITELVQADPNTTLTASITRSSVISSPASLVSPTPHSFSHSSASASPSPSLSPSSIAASTLLTTPSDILIDFSHKEAVLNHVKLCLQHNMGMVIGVTGLSEQQKDSIHSASQHLPILLAPNMSVGANVSFKLLEMVARLLVEQSQNPDIAITEIHHRHKKDAPSGTAKRMGEIIAKQFGKTLEQSGIQFSSLRLGEVMGDHHALFAFGGEQLEITHKAEDRIIFAQGALLAAKWLFGKPAGLYDMQDVLGL